MPTLTSDQLRSWDRDGFLVLRSVFSRSEVDSYLAEVDQLVQNRAHEAGETTVDVLLQPDNSQRMLLCDATEADLAYPYKVNDLFISFAPCRRLALDPRLRGTLDTLISGSAVIINSLSLRMGSQQAMHCDTFYMPPPATDKMVVASICLEDQVPQAGPLVYYAGSHRIPPYRFSHGEIHAVPEEMPQALGYVHSSLDAAGLEPASFVGNAGDVFIWHSQLFHGGMPIEDPDRTRKTLVVHYWRREDMQPDQVLEDPETGGFIMKRGHPPV